MLDRVAKERFLTEARCHVDAAPRFSILLGGDWNILASGDYRLDASRGEARDAVDTAGCFDTFRGLRGDVAIAVHVWPQLCGWVS